VIAEMGDIVQEDIDKLNACRNAIDGHKSRCMSMVSAIDRTSSVEEYMSTLSDNGFDSGDAFIQFNNFMNMCGWIENRPMIGDCDKCPDLKDEDVVCIQLADKWGIDRSEVCRNKDYDKDTNYVNAVMLRVQHDIQPDENNKSYLCPKRYIDYTQPEPFDLTWTVQK
jgi:hypothetical protein